MKKWFYKALTQNRLTAKRTGYEDLVGQLVEFANNNNLIPGEIVIIHFMDLDHAVQVQIMYYSNKEIV